MSAPTTLPIQAINHTAETPAQSHLPTSLPPTDQLVQAIAATFPPPALANTTATPAADTVAAHVQLTFPGQGHTS
jgi:hypothetical protein